MIATIILAIGFALIIEGLVLALAPSRIDTLLEMLRQMPVETRRNLGLGALALGVALIWLARGLAG